MNDAIFSQIDFGPLAEFLNDDDVTDISYSNNGQVWLKTLSKGVYQVERPDINNPFMEKLAFQCSNVMGKTFNMAHPFLDSESAELRMNFVHDSIATNGIAVLIRKTPAKIRLNKDKLLNEDYVTENIHDFLIKCVQGHCNIIVAGETGSGKTELVKYLASNTAENEKLITIEDTLELHLDKIFFFFYIVAMKTNNIASYSDVLVTCMRQNPKWILLSEVRSAEAVMAVRNSISSGHNILSTIHADRAPSIPLRMYSLLETSQEVEQFLTTIHRYVQIGIYVKGYFSKRLNRFQREIIEVCEFYVDEETQQATSNMIYKKDLDGHFTLHNPTKHLLDYMAIQNVMLPEDTFGLGDNTEKTGDIGVDGKTEAGSALSNTEDDNQKKPTLKDLNEALNGPSEPTNEQPQPEVPQESSQPEEQPQEIPTPQVQEPVQKNESAPVPELQPVQTNNKPEVKANDEPKVENNTNQVVNEIPQPMVNQNNGETQEEVVEENQTMKPKFNNPEMFDIMDFPDDDDSGVEVL